ncbi:MAG: 5-formaminoimidazole-4-carboxamide-1-(beta)-D-ribofuranosyl 5'-monophosphate synthetase [Thermoplasmata archaeon]|nr:MAG: 5-formaminoimidazole-4-carboxamide-1-(beta)-D-ribofuranosyl 5'-monophosphate synthetase [Thermoplasmata archaeon]
MAAVSKEEIMRIVEEYDKKDIRIATVCSHSSLQIFHGARVEGFKTIGIAISKKPRFYDAFPLAKPDEFIIVDSYEEIMDIEDELIERNAIVVPHGSFVEYLGHKNFMEFRVPTFGNRRVLEWESDRDKERLWLESAGIKMPRKIESPEKINFPVLVKYDGAKGGKGFFIAKDYAEFKIGIDYTKKYTIQEYILGTRYYLHYFYSPIDNSGYRLSRGSLYLMGIDRRDESNIDEMYKLGSQEELKKYGLFPSFVVTGNVPVVIRESLLERVFEMGASVVEKSFELFGGMIGPFCLESIVTDELEFRVFEISARIVAGTNLYIGGSPYTEMIEKDMSMGRRIAREIKNAIALNMLDEIIS